jgi:type IV pilus assembly protein PilV
VIVLAIGVLGLAGLQLAGMRSNYSAYQRTQAILAASDLIDRMRVSPTAFADQSFTTDSAADLDIFDHWARNLADILPAPARDSQGSVNCSNTGNACQAGNCEVVVRWDDSRAEDSTVAQDSRRDPRSLTYRVCTRLPESP